MFRKPKQTIAPLPKPPTESQMLEDLQLFHETRPQAKHTCGENSPTDTEELNIDEWWKGYEASLESHEKLLDMKTEVDQLRQTLQKTRDELCVASEEIQTRIEKYLEKLRVTMKH